MFGFPPGELINESELARELGVSRTPLRSLLNRLEAEGFLMRSEHRGFRCRNLDARSIFDLYEVRCELEVYAVRRFCDRGNIGDAEALLEFCLTEGRERLLWNDGQQLDHDESFHCQLVGLTGNSALVRQLSAINGKIRFVRWLDMPGRLEPSAREHLAIVDALCRLDRDNAEHLLRKHIGRRAEVIQQIVKTGYLKIYTGMSDPENRLENTV